MNHNYKILLICLILSQLLFSETYLGYVKDIEFSVCMDNCSEFYLETESSEYISNIISVNANIDLSLFSNRFVNINLGQQYQCVSCEALLVTNIQLSDQCINPVECFIDPCAIADCIDNYECFPNYCGGCYADCIEMQPGDINHDGDINVLDVIDLIGFILLVSEPNEYQFITSDIDGNNNLNILDVVALVSIILE